MISIRFDPKLLELLDKVAETPNTVYTGKTRTHLIEKAVSDQYAIFKQSENRS